VVDELLTRAEVAAAFGVNAQTVMRWTAAGKLPSVKTLGGHHRYRAEEVQRLRESLTTGLTVRR
jgi:excisionase family DNA binding protein